MISPDTTITVERSRSYPLLTSLRPYIAEIVAGMQSGLTLRDAVDSADRSYRNCSEHFLRGNQFDSFGLDPDLLFLQNDVVNRFSFRNRVSQETLEVNDLTPAEVREIGNTLHLLSTARTANDVRHAPYPELIEALQELGMIQNKRRPSDWNIPEGSSAIIRFQHASVLLQTKTTRVIIDPHFVSHCASLICKQSMLLPHHLPRLDAVLISHSHIDHYDIPTLLMMPRDTLVVVPQVPRETILGPNISAELRSFGFTRVIEPSWYSDAFRVGDIEISALPFYGEQPLRYEHTRDPQLRNWGNSYLFRTPEYSAWCLIDSGADADGSMIQVAHKIKEKHGSVDVVLSNLQEFFVGNAKGNPFYTMGRGECWLSLTTDQMRRFPWVRDLITLGPAGVAEICAIVGAKTFLPYAHTWSDVGTVPKWELRLLESLQTDRMFRSSGTRIVNWRIGESWQA